MESDSKATNDTTPNDVTPSEATAGEVTTGEVTTGEVTTGEVTTGEVTTGEVTTGEVTTGEVTTGEVTTGEVTTGEVTTGEVTTGEVTTGEVMANETTPSDKPSTGSSPIVKALTDYFARIQNFARTNPRFVFVVVAVIVWIIIEAIIRRLIPVPTPHVSLGGDPIFAAGPAWLTNSILTTIIVDIVLIVIALIVNARKNIIPSGFYNAVEAVVEYLANLADSVAGKNARKFFPWAATLFFFIIISNWSGLIPGVGSIGFVHTDPAESEGEHALVMDRQLAMADGMLLLQEGEGEGQEGEGEEGETADEEHHELFVPWFRSPSADLNTTFALSILTMIAVQVWGVRFQGGKYFRKFWNTSGDSLLFKGINIFVSILELISEFARILAFAFRLFGNIFAGEIVLATMAFLIAFILPIPFYMLEVFVGFVQALVFMMLCLGFFTMASISHGADHDDAHAPAHADAHAAPAVEQLPEPAVH